MPPPHLALAIYLGFAVVGGLTVFWLWAAIRTLRDEPEERQGRWFLIVLFGWVFGALIYVAARTWRFRVARRAGAPARW